MVNRRLASACRDPGSKTDESVFWVEVANEKDNALLIFWDAVAPVQARKLSR